MIVGLILPILRHFTFGMPPLYPTAISMSFELATYGLVSGLIYKNSRWKCIIALYEALIIAMLAGIIFQLIFIPSLMLALHKTGLVKIHKKNKAKIEV